MSTKQGLTDCPESIVCQVLSRASLPKMQEMDDQNHRGRFIRLVELVRTAATISRLIFDILYTIADLQNRASGGSRQL
jgi:hypothetical protein